MTKLFGTLVLQSRNGSVSDIIIPSLSELSISRGSHVPSKYSGMWLEIKDAYTTDVLVPQRYKQMTVSSTTEASALALASGLETLDSQYIEARQVYKLNKLLEDLNYLSRPWAAVVNTSSPASYIGKPPSGSICLLSSGTPLYLYLIFDIKRGNTRLMWSTEDLKQEIRSSEPLQYVFFSMPLIVNRPVFLPTQYLCSRWWSLIKGAEEDLYCLLKAANALEMLLFKDPQIERHGN